VRTREMKDQIFTIRKSEQGRESARAMLQKHGSRKGTGSRVKRKKSTDGQLALFKD